MALPETGVDPEVRQRVVQATTDTLAVLLERDEPVTEGMRLMDELMVSSLLGLELLLRLEEQLDIQIDVELMDQDQIHTVGDLATFVAGHHRPA
ncbi:MAG TPA: phosphopantetheine-binding protein [Jatrophihabitans sp.]|jgi:acyl carrier protein|uniref:phosphopantetheine-binding protein n=1 Tax=Jatrophihabitans sp. TaxID=1932789 RepID=UPI002EE27AE3